MQVPHFRGIPIAELPPETRIGESIRSGLSKAAQWFEDHIGNGGGPAGPSQARAGATADHAAPTSAADVARAWAEIASDIGRTTSTFP